MDITHLRTTLLALTATASVALAAAAPAVHAQAIDPVAAHGQRCMVNGRILQDGQINTYRYPGMRGSFTCTDGTVCETWTSSYNGHTDWGSECTYAPAPDVRAPTRTGTSTSAATAKTQAKAAR